MMGNNEEANARLIAAAPAMLSELRTLRARNAELVEALTQCFETGSLTPLTPNTIRTARAALIHNADNQ